MSAKACQETVEHSGHLKFFSAVFYAGSSFLITVVNKTVLTGFRYVALCHSFTWCQCTEGADGNTMIHASLCNQPALLLFTCWLVFCRFPSFLCLGIGQVSCPGVQIFLSHPLSVCHTLTNTHGHFGPSRWSPLLLSYMLPKWAKQSSFKTSTGAFS